MTDSNARSIAVLAGGRSPEHDVSIQSASQLVAALRRERWQPWIARLDREATVWHVREDSPPADDTAAFEQGSWQTMPGGVALEWLRSERGIEIAFPVMHGPYGEDGTIQGMLALLGIPCVGSGVAASAIGIDKIRTREVLTARGIPMARGYVGARPLLEADPEQEARGVAESVGFPCFAKVDTSGSSLGVARIEDAAQLADFLEQHRTLGRRWVAEGEVRGEEISVPVLGNAGAALEPLPPIGIYPVSASHFTYEAKYTPNATEEVVPPRGLDAAQLATAQELAMRCHEALGCDGMSRTDMIFTPDGPIVLEVNTIPGLTPASLLPKSAAHHGIEFPRLLDRLLDAGLDRWGAA